MLELPVKGLSRSVTKHNVNMALFCDWLEAGTIFGDELTGGDVVDVLREADLYADQDFAWELWANALSTIRSRALALGAGYPIRISETSTRLSIAESWEEYAPYAFCLTLSLLSYYPKWAKTFGNNFSEQGALFEELTSESATSLFSGWTAIPTGWNRTHAQKLNLVVAEISTRLRETMGETSRWTRALANDAGIDVLCYRDFADGRSGLPAMLFQCASGADWPNKLQTPDLRVWCKLIAFPNDPKKAFSMPYALEDKDFTRNCNLVNGLLLDRTRLLAPGQTARDWVTEELKIKLLDWTRPKITTLPGVAIL